MSKQKPLFTVFMPVYNAAAYLGEAIESILNQTIKDFEFLIIDDGSTDESLAIIKRYANQDARIRLITRPNKGFVKTLEEGLAAVTTDLVARMDSDDIVLPNRFEKQYAFLESHPDHSIVGCQFQLMSEKGELDAIDPKPTTDKNIKLFLGFGSALAGPAVMFRKQVVMNVGGFKQSAWPAEDYDCWSRIVENDLSIKIHNLPDVLYLYRVNNAGISLTNKRAQIKLTNEIGTTYRQRLLEQGWKYLTYRSHVGWFNDLKHLDTESQREQLRSIYYAVQSWFIRDQKKYNKPKAFWNMCKLHILTWLVNRQDMRFIKGQPAAHVMPETEN